MQVSCYDYALNYLSRYPKTSHDLALQLKKKGYEEEERGEAVVRLEEIGLLDDRNYAEQYLHSEVVRKGKALFVVKQKLWQKGVEKEIVDELCEEMEEELEKGQRSKIKKEMERCFDEKSEELRAKSEEMKFIKKMQGRGYGYALIQEVLTAL